MGGPVKPLRVLAVVPFTGQLSRNLPPLVQLIRPEASASAAINFGDDGTVPSSRNQRSSGALFGEPQDVVDILRAEPGLTALGAVAFQGHAVWSNMQLLAEIARGNWGITPVV